MSQIEVSSTGNADFLKYRPSEKRGEAKWADIQDLINRWAKRNPKAAIETERYVRSLHAELADKKHGTSKDEKTGIVNRVGICIHPELMNYIQAFYPNFMDTKEDLHEFKKRFPKFRIASEV